MPHKPRHPQGATAQWAAGVDMAYFLAPFGYILYKFYLYVCVVVLGVLFVPVRIPKPTVHGQEKGRRTGRGLHSMQGYEIM